jgi:hypothetical protein
VLASIPTAFAHPATLAFHQIVSASLQIAKMVTLAQIQSVESQLQEPLRRKLQLLLNQQPLRKQFVKMVTLAQIQSVESQLQQLQEPLQRKLQLLLNQQPLRKQFVKRVTLAPIQIVELKLQQLQEPILMKALSAQKVTLVSRLYVAKTHALQAPSERLLIV